jgi:alpha-ketoglutarate-dependent taurine dioxygenase
MTPAQRAAAPPVEHPMVTRHPRTGRRILYISRHVSHIAGKERTRSDDLLDALMEHATQERFVFRHRWGPRDVAAGERRVLHRTVVLT